MFQLWLTQPSKSAASRAFEIKPLDQSSRFCIGHLFNKPFYALRAGEPCHQELDLCCWFMQRGLETMFQPCLRIQFESCNSQILSSSQQGDIQTLTFLRLHPQYLRKQRYAVYKAQMLCTGTPVLFMDLSEKPLTPILASVTRRREQLTLQIWILCKPFGLHPSFPEDAKFWFVY